MSGLWRHAFPSAQMVDSAAGLFTGHRVSERVLGVTLLGDHGPEDSPSGRLGRELFGDSRSSTTHLDRELIEGPRWRIEISPGVVRIAATDPARAERAHERSVNALADLRDWDQDTPPDRSVESPRTETSSSRCVTSWSRKSRTRMAYTMAALDWSPLFAGGDVPAMVTLTYPGDWLAVAPDAATSRGHVLALRKRFERAYRRPLVGVWKREFQARGAAHYHFLMVPPHHGPRFSEWLSRTWAEIVKADWCGEVCWKESACCERGRHVLAGTGIDYAEGIKARDPRSIGVYFAKHGSFADKEYQNTAPPEWIAAGSVGRFWGVWGLERATAAVLLAPSEAQAVVRTLRRYSRANAYETRVPVWRYRTVTDAETGEVRAKWRRATKKARIYRVKGSAGFLVVKDGPAFAGKLSTHLDRLYRPSSVVSRSGSGPVGFLP